MTLGQNRAQQLVDICVDDDVSFLNEKQYCITRHIFSWSAGRGNFIYLFFFLKCEEKNETKNEKKKL